MRGRWCWFLFATTFLQTNVDATTVVKLDTRALVHRASRIVEAEVVATQCVRDVRGRIVTRIDLRVDADGYWKGEGQRQFSLILPGGVLEREGRALFVPGMPVLRVGERNVLFLTDSASGGSGTIVGLEQGRARIVRDARTGAKRIVRDLNGLEFVDARTGRVLHEPTPRIEVRDYEVYRRHVRELIDREGK